MSKQETSQTPRLLIVSALTLLLWFALFGYVRDMPLFQSLFRVDSLLLLGLGVFSYLGTDLGSELDLQKFGGNLRNLLPNTKAFITKNNTLLTRRFVPLFGLWFVRALIDVLVHMYVPRVFRPLALVGGYITYSTLPTLNKDGPMLGNMQIGGYEVSLILGALVSLRLIQQNYYSNIDRLIPASVLGGWMLYLMGTYLAGYDITKLKKFISFWFFTLVVGISFARQGITLLKTRFENNKIERIVYEEKIIYVPEEIDQYEDNDLIEPVAESAPITITQIDEESQVLSPTNILDTTDTQGETLAQQLLRLTADENNTQEGRDELVELQ